MNKRFCAARMLLGSGHYSYYATYKCGAGVERGDFATREEAQAEADRLNHQPGHRAIPKADFSRCGFCGGPTPCLRQN